MILIEGLPGTGKTTLAGRLQRALAARGVAASWWREEEIDHPITPRTLRRTAAQPGFAERCIRQWIRFASQRREGAELPILEGTAFQSTIRFMLEHELSREEILAYVRAFDAAVTPADARLVYLAPDDARAFAVHFVHPARGAEWVSKVSAHLAGTPFCRRRGWSGAEGMIEFWMAYRELCEEALAALRLPVLRLGVGPAHWPEAHERVLAWIGSS